jgi:hypothetical protein
MTRLARGSLPWPYRISSCPAALGALVTETALPAGARLRISAWWRRGPTGEAWLSLECSPYPRGGRPTAYKRTSGH